MIGNWINYISFIVIVAIGFLFYHNYLLLLLLAAITILPVITILFFRKMSGKIDFEISDIPVNAGRNADIQFNIITKNRSFYPMSGIKLKLSVKNLFYENNKEYVLNVADIPFKTTQTEWKFKSLYSGCVKVCIESAQMYDVLNLAKKNIDLNIEKVIEIFPEEGKVDLDIQALSEGAGEDTEVQYRKGTDVSEVSGIRQYEPGDSLQSIHWKMTARYDDWMVKEYSMPYTNKFCLILELYRNDDIPDEMDIVIEAYMSYAKYIVKSGRQFFMIWYNAKTMSNVTREVQTEEDIMLVIKDILYTSPSNIRTRAYDAYKYEYGNSTYTGFYVTNASSAEMVSGDRIAAYKGKAVLISI